MLTSQQERQRLAEFEDRYSIVKPAVDQLVKTRLRVGKNEKTPGFIDVGSGAAVFKITVNGLDLAVRLRKIIRLGPAPNDLFAGSYARAMARSLHQDCTEQGFALNRNEGVMVSRFVDGIPHHKRGLRGGLWLFADDVQRLVDAQDNFSQLGVRRDAGRMDNLLVGSAGLTLVDMLASTSPSPTAEEHLIPELLFTFSPRLSVPRGTTAEMEKQYAELEGVAAIFKDKYPESQYCTFVDYVLNGYYQKAAQEPTSLA